MAGRYVDAGLCAVVYDGEGELRRGTQRVEHAHVNAIGSHDGGGLMGKELGVDAAVIAADNALAAGFRPLGLDDLGKGLGGVADDMHIHAAQTHGHFAAQARGAKLQRGEKAAFDLLGIVFNGLQLLPLRGAECGAVQPTLIFFLITHWISSPSKSFSPSIREAASCKRVSGT